ncbi:hypothetical protein CEP17_08660 [Microbacterium sp. PM5]|nr:hypothetical protein CEP17_08660 [Microbacterium sp. PM5]
MTRGGIPEGEGRPVGVVESGEHADTASDRGGHSSSHHGRRRGREGQDGCREHPERAPSGPGPGAAPRGGCRARTGLSAVDPRWVGEPATAVAAVGAGLRALHDALPVADCPFDWSVPARVAAARRRGIRLPVALTEGPVVDRLVVCHGDACCPNTLIGGDGRWSGHVDLGALGVADRWADIAVAAMSTEWNYGPGWERALLDGYGIDADAERMSFYRDLWNAT